MQKNCFQEKILELILSLYAVITYRDAIIDGYAKFDFHGSCSEREFLCSLRP